MRLIVGNTVVLGQTKSFIQGLGPGPWTVVVGLFYDVDASWSAAFTCQAKQVISHVEKDFCSYG